jgi:hypothetical protein
MVKLPIAIKLLPAVDLLVPTLMIGMLNKIVELPSAAALLVK